MIVVHQDDYVELTLVNPETNTLQHNIDFHAATGALGGGALTVVNPVKRPSCASRPPRWRLRLPLRTSRMVPWHVTSGMNGAIMVLPRDGLKDHKGNDLVYDRVYYVGEQDFLCASRRKGQLPQV